MCVQGRVYWGKACATCARNGFRGFPELFVLPHSQAPAGARTVGLVRHGTCLRRVQGCGIGESVNLDNLGLELTVHESRVTSVQKRMEPRRSLLGASVDVTDARNDQAGRQTHRWSVFRSLITGQSISDYRTIGLVQLITTGIHFLPPPAHHRQFEETASDETPLHGVMRPPD